MSDAAFSEAYVVTADHAGCVRLWQRPGPLERVSMTARTAVLNAAGDGPHR